VDRTDFGHLAARALLAAAVLASAPGAAIAQTVDAAKGGEIVVEAPRSLPIVVGRSPYSGAPIVVVTVKIPVHYYDLDLKDPASAPRLMKRVERVAHDACAELDRLYPHISDASCVDKAIANGRVAARAAIAKAAR
jgi:UrcA family protein